MDARSAHEMVSDVMFVDVREAYEFKAGHITGSVHIPLGELPARIDDIDAARVVTVCKVGARSAEAAKFMRAFGIEAENLDGGVLAWVEAGFDLVTAEGRRGRVMM